MMRSLLFLLLGLSNRLPLRGALLKSVDCFSRLGSKILRVRFCHHRRGAILGGLKKIMSMLCLTSFQEMFSIKMFRSAFHRLLPLSTSVPTAGSGTAGKLSWNGCVCWASSFGEIFLSPVMSLIRTKLAMIFGNMRPIFRRSMQGAFCVTFPHPLG